MRRVLLLAAALLPLCGLFAEVLSESAGGGRVPPAGRKGGDPAQEAGAGGGLLRLFRPGLVRGRRKGGRHSAGPEPGGASRGGAEAPGVGGLTTPNPEKVLALKPDLVLLLDKFEKHRAVSEVLNRAGVETVLLECGNYTDFSGLLDLFCRLNGTTVAAHPEGKRITDEVAAVCREVSALPPPSAAIVFAATHGFKLEGDESNTGTMLKMLGAGNIASGIRGVRAGFSFERLLVEDPDVILVVTMATPRR